MNLRCLPLRLSIYWLTIGCLAWITYPARSQEPAPPRQKEISDLETQIEALTKKLSTLRQGATKASASAELNSEWVKTLTWRSIGPATMGGRITAISVFPGDPTYYFVATASGGLLKTVNNGVTFEHVFDHESTVSIGDVCVAPSDKNIVWVGTGENNPRNSVSYGDGVYKSTDGGKTWQHMGLQKTFQIGRLVIHPKDSNIVYVGALGRLYGPNPERGLFKTTDGGKTWDKVLYVDDKTGVIDVQMNPADPNTLLAATWERQRDGFDSHRGLPFLAEGYDAYDPSKKWGPGSGIYKTTDAGKTFKKLTQGLPTCALGRIGLDYYQKEPKTVFAIIDSEKIGMGTPAPPGGQGNQQSAAYLGINGDDADAGARLTTVEEGGPAAKAGLKVGDIVIAVDDKIVLSFGGLVDALKNKKPGDKVKFKVARNRAGQEIVATLGPRPELQVPRGRFANPRRPNSFMYGGQRENIQEQQGPDSFQYGGLYKSTDNGETWHRINSLNPRPMYFSQVRVDPSDDKNLYVLGIALYRSQDGGKTFKPDGSNGVHPDQHALWIDAHDGRHMIVGCDGGFYVTYDRMANWDYLNHLAIAQFYHVAVDHRRLYHVYGGLQDNGSWAGPSHTLDGGGPLNEDWGLVSGGDGFVCRVDVNDPDVVYAESQDGFMVRRNLKTGEFFSVRPRGPEGLVARTEWVASLLNPTGGLLARLGAVPAAIMAQEEAQYRFNWNTPFVLSHHNSHIFYCGGNYVFRSLNRGTDLRAISPEITRTKRGSASALAESPLTADVLYCGTDDGALWVTRDGGIKWTNITAKIPLPGPRWVASVEPSRFAPGRAYVVFDAHRSDDDEPYVFMTEDYGQTWKSLRANLPTGSTRVLREDIQNQDLLYLGTEFGIWASLDRGRTWARLNSNLPTVAVHEIAMHPTEGEIVAATHGRSLWILDVTPLRQMTSAVLQAKAHLYQPKSAVRWHFEPGRGSPFGFGSRHFAGQNPPPGAQLYYSLTKKAEKVSLKIVDFDGKTVRELPAKPESGLHKVPWDLLRVMNNPPPGQPPGRGQGRRGGNNPPLTQAAPGTYRVVLTVDGAELTQSVRVEADPAGQTPLIAPVQEPSREK